MKKIGSLLTMILVMNLVAALGLAGYLLATGRLDKEKATAMLDMVKHKGTPEKLREKLYDIMEPTPATSTAPSTQSLAAKTVENELTSVLAASASDRLEMSRQAIEQERLKLEAEAQDLRNRQKTLEDKQSELKELLKKVEDAKGAYQKKVEADAAKGKDESFKKTLALYDELKPKQLKEIFLGMPEETVAEFLAAMDESRSGKIIAEFKSPTEKTFILKVLETIRGAGGTGNASGTSMTSAGGPPAGI